MNIYSKHFTVEELHFHLWNEIYNFVYENWDKIKYIPSLPILKQEIIEEFKDKGIIYEYKDVINDCFLCEEYKYKCYDCPLTRAYHYLCMNQNSFFSLALHYFYSRYFYEEKENKETVLLAIAKVRDCYSYLNGDS